MGVEAVIIEKECTLYEDDDVALFWSPCQESKFSVVTFTPRLSVKQPGPAKIGSGFGYKFFSSKRITGFYIIPKWNHWWQVPGMGPIVRLIREKQYPKQSLWTYGVSMGGNGALMFAAALEAQGVISFNPQVSVSLKSADFDPRWMDDRHAIENFDDSWLLNRIPEQTWIFGDSGFSLDKRHVDLISNFHPKVNYISVPFSGHSTIRALMESALLSSTILGLMTSEFSPASFKKKFRAERRVSPVIWTEASNRLSRRGSDRAAFYSSSRAIKLLRESHASGMAIDVANSALSIVTHSNNILKLRHKDEAEAFLEALQHNPIINFDFSWQKFQLADFLGKRTEIANLIQSRLYAGDLDEKWFSALISTTKAGVVTPLMVSEWEDRIGKKILNSDQAKRYASIVSNISSHAHLTSDGDEKVQYIFGPSHALRWSIHAANHVVDTGVSPANIIGWGGAPIWDKRLFETAKDKAKGATRIGVIVSDFLFGNKVCLSTGNQTEVMREGFLGIDATALSLENDAVMLQRGLQGVMLWHQHFKQRARFIFWCLFGRQILDRLAGRYVVDNQYNHPTFNYSDIRSRLPGIDIVDLDPLLQLPIHEVSRLFIDGNSNPSYIAYLLLEAVLVEGMQPIDAYDQIVAVFETELLALARETKRLHHSPILLTGRSVWLDTIVRYMGADGAEKLADVGIILAPIDKYAGRQYSIEKLPDGILLEECTIFIISSQGKDLCEILANKTNTTVEAWRDISVIDWEGSTASIITSRGETPKFSHSGIDLPSRGEVETQALQPHMVEIGPFGIPTWTGLRHIFSAIAAMKGNSIASHCGYRIEGGVLLSEGIAFLIEGNHSVLKYATGALTPTKQSLQNFSNNILSRSDLTRKMSIPYAHVIFPDKQTVLKDAFPFKPIHCLGDDYLNVMDPSVRKHVIYPTELLTEAGNAFWPMDTHLTDFGSLVVLRSMLENVGIHANGSLKHIEKMINKTTNWSGDLGNKLKPPLRQNGVLLNPDWKVKILRNNVGFNDGLIDVFLNQEATLDKTVLMFGDSFFRMMLQHLSAIFTRVICLRTRFMHPEMLFSIKPDIVFTGNAERYLSNVTSDADAHAFYLYPHMRQGSDLTMDQDFLEAWAAITSPGSARHRDFLKKMQ